MENHSEVKRGAVKATERVTAFLVGAALVLCLTTSNRAAGRIHKALLRDVR